VWTVYNGVEFMRFARSVYEEMITSINTWFFRMIRTITITKLRNYD